MYAFFKLDPQMEYIDGRWAHTFQCANTSCKHTVRRYLSSKDRSSTSNLRKHTRKCWGVEALDTMDHMTTVSRAKDSVEKYRRTQNLKVVFGAASKKTFCYSTVQHTPTETR